MNKKIIRGIFLISFFTCIFFLGWSSNELYDYYNYHRELNGMYLRNYNQERARNKVYDRDELGDWVCVNVRDMSYEKAYETCRHEVSHEIFAESCEGNLTKCLKAVEE